MTTEKYEHNWNKEELNDLFPFISVDEKYFTINRDKTHSINIFVYGTLLPNTTMYNSIFSNTIHSYEEGTVKGELYSMADSFPCLVKGDKDIKGIMYRIKGNESELFDLMYNLNSYESALSKDPLYRLEKKETKTTKGIEKAHVYMYNQNVEGLKKIESDSWNEYINEINSQKTKLNGGNR